jgi:hypothetical protein
VEKDRVFVDRKTCTQAFNKVKAKSRITKKGNDKNR